MVEEEDFKIDEPLSEYFKSEKFLKSYKKITISSLEEQEEANLQFSLLLSPVQRLEYLFILNMRFFSEKIRQLPSIYQGKINIDY